MACGHCAESRGGAGVGVCSTNRLSMACDHCGKARHASKLALKAVATGDISDGVARLKEAAAHIRAKFAKGDDDGEAHRTPTDSTGPRLR